MADNWMHYWIGLKHDMAFLWRLNERGAGPLTADVALWARALYAATQQMKRGGPDA